MKWIHGETDNHSLVKWLEGDAGAGKSAIARRIAELCEERGLPVATFFFKRTDTTRNTAERLIASLAYSFILARALPDPIRDALRDSIAGVVEANPHIFSFDMSVQLTKLVIEPMERLPNVNPLQITHTYVIVIDGLDECLDEEEQETILRFIPSIPKVGWKVVVSSRNEPTISSLFNHAMMKEISTRCALGEFRADDDIRLFLQEQFRDFKVTCPQGLVPDDWPPDSAIEELVQRSSCLFLYAVTAVKQVASPRYRSEACDRLRTILQEASCNNGAIDTQRSTALNALYTQIFVSTGHKTTALSIIGLCLLYSKDGRGNLTAAMVANILSINPHTLNSILERLDAILEVIDSSGPDIGTIQLFHASIDDYFSDQARSNELCVDDGVPSPETCRGLTRTLEKDGEGCLQEDPMHFKKRNALALGRSLKPKNRTLDATAHPKRAYITTVGHCVRTIAPDRLGTKSLIFIMWISIILLSLDLIPNPRIGRTDHPLVGQSKKNLQKKSAGKTHGKFANGK